MDIAPSTHTSAPAVTRSRWRYSAQTLLIGLAVLAVSLALFAFIQFGTSTFAGHDAYYHAKMGLLIRQQGLKPDFIWLPNTILNPAAYYDHHMLFHVWLSLFVGNGDEQQMLFGAKIATVIMGSLIVLAVWWLLRSQRVRWAAVWAIGLFALSQAFLFRMSMTRGQAPSLLLLMLGLYALLQRRYWLLLPLGFLYVWLYNAFPLLLVVAGTYAVAAFLTERRLAWQALAYPTVGIVLGLLINPYFPQDITFIIDHLLPKLSDATASQVGNEWYPYDTWTLVQNSGLALAAWLLGAMALGWRGRRMDVATLTAFVLSVGFGYMLFQSRRFVEYFPAFALVFAALSIAPVLDDLLAGLRPRLRRFAPGVLAALLLIPLYLTVRDARAATTNQSMPAGMFQDASHWLRDNTPPGSMVFQTDWDDFPVLFFYNTSNVYTAGLDPTFMELYDADLYSEWVKITRGQVENPAEIIQSRFGATYVLTDLEHGDFITQAQRDPRMEEVYRDQHAAVFHIRQ